MDDSQDGLSDFDHYLMVVSAFCGYSEKQNQIIDVLESDFHSIPQDHQQLILEYQHKLDSLRSCVDSNSSFLKTVAKSPPFFPINVQDSEAVRSSFRKALNGDLMFYHDQHEKVYATLKSLFREWSIEGKPERDQAFQPLVDCICNRFPDKSNRSNVKILVPGCGLGRLVHEFARLGFDSLGLEFSFFMVLMSGFVLNRTKTAEEITIFPFIHSLLNTKTNSDLLRPIKIPDISVTDFGDTIPQLSICAGDFVDALTEENHFDVICCSFFLDTARDIVEYLKIIYKILKPGGILVSIGPLTWHWNKSTCQGSFVSIELSHEEIMLLLPRIGFKVIKNDWMTCQYCQEPNSLSKSEYNCFYFEAIKE
ncbi:hypothetical protein RCL1_002269 [Eukaryota sp. TZLM3-RCL]